MSAPITLQARVEDYLAERRRLGFALRSSALALRSFSNYVDRVGHSGPLTIEVMAEWARHDTFDRSTPATWARRLKKLRPFTRYLRQFEPRTEVPDEAVFGLRQADSRRTSTASTRSLTCWPLPGRCRRAAGCARPPTRRCSG